MKDLEKTQEVKDVVLLILSGVCSSCNQSLLNLQVWKADLASLELNQAQELTLQELQNYFIGKNHSTLECILFAVEIMFAIQVAPSRSFSG